MSGEPITWRYMLSLDDPIMWWIMYAIALKIVTKRIS